MHVPMTTNL